ncbi:MAG: endonuclease/exonuclease/phosphatase family protein [Salinivirgaceae bacterium]|nr:endonuclease/exonuclease/phosphatase family protein [Salinivirgaceae bacterium]
MFSKFFTKVFLWINYFVIILLLLGYLASEVSPQQIPLFNFFALLFPYFILLNIASVVFWLFLQKRYFLYSLIVLVIGFNKITNTFSLSFRSQEIETTDAFSLLSYNARVFDLYDWTHNEVTRDQIFSSLRTESPDIACFQEYFNNTGTYFPVHDSLMQNQRFSFAHININVSLSNGHNFGIATYSIYPIVGKSVVEFEKSSNQVLISDIKINKDTIRLFNCHLESVRFLREDYQFMDSINKVSEERRKKGIKGVSKRLARASKKRAHQAELIKELILQSEYPVIVCGDFNDVPSSYIYKTLVKDLSDSHKEMNIGVGGTYRRFFPSNRIDYILHDTDLKCVSFSKLNWPYSDHYPIIGKYKLVK